MLTVNAGSDITQEVNFANKDIALIGGSANDTVYSIVSITWSVTGSYAATIDNPTHPNSDAVLHLRQFAGTYTVTLTALNSNGDTATDTRTVELSPGITGTAAIEYFDDTNMWYNSFSPQPAIFNVNQNEFATAKFTTNANKILVTGYTTYSGGGGKLGIIIDGVESIVQMGDAGQYNHVVITLGNPGIDKDVEIVVGGFSSAFGTAINYYNTLAYLQYTNTDTLTITPPSSTTGGIFLVGDSILGSPLNNFMRSVARQLIIDYGLDVTVEAASGLGFYAYASNPTLQNDLIARIVAKAPTHIYFEICTNDWAAPLATPSWNTSHYTTAFSSFITDLRAALNTEGLSSTIIYIQSLMHRSDASINSNGVTLIAFRSAQSSMATSLGETFVNGLDVITAPNIDGNGGDTLHPGLQGVTDDFAPFLANLFSGSTPLSVNVGSNQSITLPTDSVTVTATPSGGTSPYTYLWEQVGSIPSVATIIDNTSATTDIENLIEGIYTFKCTVTDDDSNTEDDTLTVTVNPELVIDDVFTGSGGNPMLFLILN